MGRRIRTLVNGRQVAGNYAVEWDGRDESGKAVSSGTYIYRLRTGTNAQSRPMILLK